MDMPRFSASAGESGSPTYADEAARRDELDRRRPRIEIAGVIEEAFRAEHNPVAPQRDSLLNGVLIGAAAGGLLGLIPDYLDDCGECHDSLYASIAIGAGVGLLVDALRTTRQGARPSRTGALRVNVMAARRAVSLRTTIRWR
jgi:hypothetical protein